MSSSVIFCGNGYYFYGDCCWLLRSINFNSAPFSVCDRQFAVVDSQTEFAEWTRSATTLQSNVVHVADDVVVVDDDFLDVLLVVVAVAVGLVQPESIGTVGKSVIVSQAFRITENLVYFGQCRLYSVKLWKYTDRGA